MPNPFPVPLLLSFRLCGAFACFPAYPTDLRVLPETSFPASSFFFPLRFKLVGAPLSPSCLMPRSPAFSLVPELSRRALFLLIRRAGPEVYPSARSSPILTVKSIPMSKKQLSSAVRVLGQRTLLHLTCGGI